MRALWVVLLMLASPVLMGANWTHGPSGSSACSEIRHGPMPTSCYSDFSSDVEPTVALDVRKCLSVDVEMFPDTADGGNTTSVVQLYSCTSASSPSTSVCNSLGTALSSSNPQVQGSGMSYLWYDVTSFDTSAEVRLRTTCNSGSSGGGGSGGGSSSDSSTSSLVAGSSAAAAEVITTLVDTYYLFPLGLAETYDASSEFTVSVSGNEACYSGDTKQFNLSAAISFDRTTGSSNTGINVSFAKAATGAHVDGDEFGTEYMRSINSTQIGMGGLIGSTSLSSGDCIALMISSDDAAFGFTMEGVGINISEPAGAAGRNTTSPTQIQIPVTTAGNILQGTGSTWAEVPNDFGTILALEQFAVSCPDGATIRVDTALTPPWLCVDWATGLPPAVGLADGAETIFFASMDGQNCDEEVNTAWTQTAANAGSPTFVTTGSVVSTPSGTYTGNYWMEMATDTDSCTFTSGAAGPDLFEAVTDYFSICYKAAATGSANVDVHILDRNGSFRVFHDLSGTAADPDPTFEIDGGTGAIFNDWGRATDPSGDLWSDGAWHSVCISTCDDTEGDCTAGASVKIWVDGVSETLDGTTGDLSWTGIADVSTVLELGRGQSGNNLSGGLDEVWITRKFLSDAEALEYHCDGASGDYELTGGGC